MNVWRAEAQDLLLRLTGNGLPPQAASFVYLLWAAVFLWLMAATGSLLVPPGGGKTAAMDAVAGPRSRFVWFVWCWMALTVVFLAALPALGLGGLVLIHLFTNAEDLFGWRF